MCQSLGLGNFVAFPSARFASSPSSHLGYEMFNFPEFHQFKQNIPSLILVHCQKAEIVVCSCSSCCPNAVCLAVSGFWLTFFHSLLIYLSSLLKTPCSRSCSSWWGKVRVKVKLNARATLATTGTVKGKCLNHLKLQRHRSVTLANCNTVCLMECLACLRTSLSLSGCPSSCLC